MLVALTGSSISQFSPLYMWEGLPLAAFLTRRFFDEDPVGFYRFYREVLLQRTEPGPIHLALADARISVITENIDGLHRKAGSNTIELFGNVNELYCPDCQGCYPSSLVLGGLPLCPSCCQLLHPHLVLEGDPVPKFKAACSLIAHARELLIIGSTLDMAPASYLPILARTFGAKITIFNRNLSEVFTYLAEEALQRL
ncbi:MAG: SIR2 family NAD-dependent protein deacylase [Limnochordia bacterium]|jgi:NAD-dependent deacetylase